MLRFCLILKYIWSVSLGFADHDYMEQKIYSLLMNELDEKFIFHRCAVRMEISIVQAQRTLLENNAFRVAARKCSETAMNPATRRPIPDGWGQRACNAMAVPQRSITK